MRTRTGTHCLVICGFGLLALLSLLWLQLDAGGRSGLGPEFRSAQVQAREATLRGGLESPEVEPGASADGNGAVRSALPSLHPLLESESPVSTGAYRVHAVTGPDRTPVAGAQVSLLRSPSKGVMDWARRGAAYHQNLELLESGVIDGHGDWAFDPPKGLQAVCVELGALWALDSVDPAVLEHELVVELLPDQSVDVKVLAAEDGSLKAGVEVGLWYVLGYDDRDLCDRVFSDASGYARFEHIQTYLGAFWPHEESLRVEPLGLLAEPIGVEIDPWKAEQSVLLEVPRTASIEVRVLGSNGQPMQQGLYVQVAPWQGENDGADEGADRAFTVYTENGTARFDQLGLGLELQVSVLLFSGGQAPEPRRLRSPTVPGTVQALELQLPKDPASLTLQLQSPEGELLALAPILIGQKRRFQTDAEGRLNVPCSSVGEPGKPLSLSLSYRDRDSALGLETFIASLPESGTLDLGTLKLEALDELVQGRVLDARGDPLVDVLIAVQWNEKEPNAWGGRDFMSVGICRSAADGSFCLRGRPGQPLLRLVASDTAFAPQVLEAIPVGTRDLELRLVGAGRIAGSVLLPEAWMRDFTNVRARPRGQEEWQQWESPDLYGRFEFGSLAPGYWDVGVSMEADPVPAIVIGDVLVVADQVQREARLQGIDLRALGKRIELFIESEAGEPIEAGELRLRLLGTSEWGDSQWFEKGHAQLFTTGQNLEVLVEAEGWRRALVLDVKSGDHIQLEPATELAVCWKSSPPELLPGYFLEIHLEVETDGLPPQPFWEGVSWDEEDLQYSPFGGGQRLASMIFIRTKDAGGQSQLLDQHRQTYPLQDRVPQQVVRVDWPAAFAGYLKPHPTPEEPAEDR